MSGVAVVVPVRDGAAHLGEALASVCAQTHPPAEIVVVDDGSRDAGAEVAASFAGVSVLRQAAAAGAGPARNRGVAATRAPLLAFLDADDVWPATALAALVGTRGGADLVRGLVTHFVSPELGGAEAARRVVPTAPLPALMPGGVLFTRELFERVGGLRADLRVGEFVDWYARAVDAGVTVVELDEVVLHRRIHAGNTGTLRRDAQADLTRAVRDTLARRRATPS